MSEKKPRSRATIRVMGISIAVLALAGMVMLAIIAVGMLNAELSGRLTETLEAPDHFSKAEGDPIVRLVLHKILPDENGIEASLVLMIREDSDLSREIKNRGVAAKAVVEDGSSAHIEAMAAETPNLTATDFKSGRWGAVVRSSRFLLPSYQSLASYPFDELMVRPMVMVHTNLGAVPFRLEVQKALPGRLLSVKEEGGFPVVTLARAVTEKTYILTASIVFVLISVVVTAALLFSSGTASGLNQVVAVAGFLVSAAGFRQLLGVDKVPGTTILEIMILGISLVLISLGVAISIFRSLRRPKEAEGDRTVEGSG